MARNRGSAEIEQQLVPFLKRTMPVDIAIGISRKLRRLEDRAQTEAARCKGLRFEVKEAKVRIAALQNELARNRDLKLTPKWRTLHWAVRVLFANDGHTQARAMRELKSADDNRKALRAAERLYG